MAKVPMIRKGRDDTGYYFHCLETQLFLTYNQIKQNVPVLGDTDLHAKRVTGEGQQSVLFTFGKTPASNSYLTEFFNSADHYIQISKFDRPLENTLSLISTKLRSRCSYFYTVDFNKATSLAQPDQLSKRATSELLTFVEAQYGIRATYSFEKPGSKGTGFSGPQNG